MGFFDKLKSAVNVVTGGAAKVTIEFNPPVAFPGDTVSVRVTAVSTGGACEGKGVFIDIQGVEEIRLKRGTVQNVDFDISTSKTLLEQSFQIAGPYQVGPGQTQYFQGQIQIPQNAQPSFDGAICDHGWGIRGRLEMFGNDPDSGFVPFRVGLRG